MKIYEIDGYVVLEGVKDFNLVHIFECGQCFRFKRQEDNSFIGVAFDKVWHLFSKENKIYISGNLNDYNIMHRFLDMDRDYEEIKKSFAIDDFTTSASNFGSGIRILRQEPWETLCSFIISQQNNIPRIMKIIDTLCTNFGEKISFNGKDYFTFPSFSKIATLSIEDLQILKSGYRAKYILSVARSLESGDFNFETLYDLDIASCRKEVLKLHGVGIKVTDCFLLFGMGKLDAFPIDTWIKKAQAFYSGNMENYGQYAGIYQQYIFYYARSLRI